MAMFAKLENRNLQPELMDDPTLPDAQHDHALRGLTRIHQFSGLVNRFWNPVRTCLELQSQYRSAAAPLPRIMDVGCGDGYLLRQIGQKARAAGIAVELIGIDMSETALRLAEAKSQAEQIQIKTRQVDILQQDLPPSDIVINSLFLHHFEADQVVQILTKFSAATKLRLIVEDLRRTSLGYVLSYVAGHALTRSSVVHYDALRSVEGAFTCGEMHVLASQAGLVGHTLTKRWPERFVIDWSNKNQ